MMDGGPSFASRRPAATALPAFSLPPPDIPRVANDGLSPSSSGVNSGSSMSSQPSTTAGPGGAYYGHMNGSWPGPGSYTFNGSSNNHNQAASPLLQQPYPGARSLYQQVSPSVPQFGHSSGRHMGSPPTPDGLPRPPSYDQPSPVFLTPISGHGGGGGGGNQNHSQMMNSHSQAQGQNTPTSGAPPDSGYRSQQLQQQQHHLQEQQQRQQHHQQQQQQHQQHGGQYAYTPSSTPQQATFPTFQSNQNTQPLPSPTDRTPTSANAASRAVASITQQGGPMSGMAPPMGFSNSRQPLPLGYQPMPGPIMTNLHQPGNPLSMMGSVGHGLPGGYPPGPPHHPHLHMYPSHSQQAQPDRPYKCDVCPQSFSRNHDLKRHKRIHLAVKPFPCTYCEKSFSRKDALKRHRLVKGCGDGTDKTGDNDSPPDRSDIMSESTEGSPIAIKKEMAEQI